MERKGKATLTKSIIEIAGFLLISLIYLIQSIVKSLLPKSYQKFKSIDGEIVLITGGGGGLGRLLALRLSKLGATIVLWDVNIEAVGETINLVEGIGGSAYGYKCDLADKEDVYRVALQTRKEVGDVTILINNAGVVSGELLLNTPDHLIKRTFDVNVIAHFWTVKAFLPRMMEKKHGHILTIASMAGFVGIHKLVDYCASKYAAIGFSEALTVELEAQGIKDIKTTVICPYFIQSTGMFDNVNSRFLSTLKPNDVANRIVEGLLKEEVVVMIPRVFTIGLILKAIMPWSITSMFLRGLVPDAVPHHTPSTVNLKQTGEDLSKKVNGSLSKTVSQLNQMISVTGKNL